MKQSTIKLIEDKFMNDIWKIDSEIRDNKSKIKQLAKRQKELKDTKKGLYDILKLIK
jgi:hypothetical protein